MKREEARIELQDMKDTFEEYEPGGSRGQMALKVALSALRPVSREQVERMRGFWEQGDPYDMGDVCCKCGYDTGREPCKWNFCPVCGKPMTDEAVEMMLERMEEMTNEH